MLYFRRSESEAHKAKSRRTSLMKHFSYVAAIIAAFFFASVVYAEQPKWPSQYRFPIQCNFGLKDAASPIVVIDNLTPVPIDSLIPAGTMGFEFRAASGSFIISSSGNIASSPIRVGRLVEQDQTYIWNGLAGTFNGSILGTAASTTVVIDGVW